MLIMKKEVAFKNQKGIATVESTLLLTIFVVFMTYCIGFFGIVHTSILNSISARAYAFETFRNRSNLTYFRDTLTQKEHYQNIGFRVHGIISETVSEDTQNDQWFVTTRTIAKGRSSPEISTKRTPTELDQTQTRESSGANPVWIKTTYGICINQKCGDS